MNKTTAAVLAALSLAALLGGNAHASTFAVTIATPQFGLRLGAPCELFAIAMWLYPSQPRAYHDVVIQVSDDPDFVQTVCPACGGPARRETDTMGGYACSSWYFLRFADVGNDRMFASRPALDYWLPVDVYTGGIEHARSHLLYARFWTKVLFDEGLLGFEEPFLLLRNQANENPDSRRITVNPGEVRHLPDVILGQCGHAGLRMMKRARVCGRRCEMRRWA